MTRFQYQPDTVEHFATVTANYLAAGRGVIHHYDADGVLVGLMPVSADEPELRDWLLNKIENR